MCGLFGYAGTLETDTRQLIARTLCVLNTSRGDDSAGIGSIVGSRCTRFRRALRPVEIVEDAKFANLTGRAEILIGHTRFATMGKICAKNQHPFRHGETVLAHNGVVRNVAECRKWTGRRYSVDSQYLCDMIDTYGTVGPAMGSLNLAYWQESKPDRLQLCAWNNPLHFAEGNGFTIYASEFDHVEYALAIAGLRAEVYEIENGSRLTVYADGTSTYRIDAPEYDLWSRSEFDYMGGVYA